MVLGLNAKNRRSASVQVDYVVHIEEIKPWPPSQSLRSLRSVLIQWENGERSSGSTNTVVPSLGSVIGEGRIEFNESFRLPVTLLRDVSVKGKDSDAFQKNCLEFNLYEPRRDKAQLLATSVIDLADYGVVNETISINTLMNSKRSFRNTPQPVLYIKIQPADNGCNGSTSKGGLSNAVSMHKNSGESVSELMNEEYAEEEEIASFTDDDVSSHSSLTNGGLSPPKNENGPDRRVKSQGGVNRGHDANSKLDIEKHIGSQENLMRSSFCTSSVDLSSDLGSPPNNSTDFNSKPTLRNNSSQNVHSSSSPLTDQSEEEEGNGSVRSNCHQDLVQEGHEKITNSTLTIRGNNNTQQNGKENISSSNNPQVDEKLGSTNSGDFQVIKENAGKPHRTDNSALEVTATNNDMRNTSTEDIIGKKYEENEQDSQNLEEEKHSSDEEPTESFPQELTRNEDSFVTDAFYSSGGTGTNRNMLKIDRLRHVKSVRSSSDSTRSNGLESRNQHNEVKEVGALGDKQNSGGNLRVDERASAKVYPKDTRATILDSKIQQLELKIMMLEGELKEAAAIEASLYSVVAEHGSSKCKVHAPARRLSRLYLHACRDSSQSRRASAARNAVSGLVLVAKACGNDVPRLTFWLSNSVVLRSIISQAIGDSELSLSAGPHNQRNGLGKGTKLISSSLKGKESSPSRKEKKNAICGDFGDWEDPHTFTSALERVEAWIFCRTVESIWWQTLTPHMQSAATKEINRFVGSGSKKNLERTSSSGDHDQGHFSLDLWKNAFKDACERLCPVRAGGHECGCLPVLVRLIMEQCVARLDVAMFNAILRESADEIPTDPVSDPIGDSKVLPIPAGRSSFGAGAQLKNAIGNWSRWLTDLFGMDDDNALEDGNEKEEDGERQDTSFKSFHLLNVLSDLMMLPKDLLLSKSIRKEVCPKFGAPLIKRVLDSFVSDEFCPDPIPDTVLEALDEEDTLEAGEELVTTIPYIAAPPIYLPPSAATIAGTIGEFRGPSQLRRSGSSVLRKSYTSDDELDELKSPITSILLDGLSTSPLQKPSWKSKEKSNENGIRYELLRDVWMNSE